MMPPDPAEMYVATEPLYVGDPASGTVPQLARQPGQLVTARALARNPGWRSKVRRREPEPPPPPAAARPARHKGA
jgi:hypothetical protein